VENKVRVEREFSSKMEEDARKKKLARWGQAVQRSIGFGWDK